LLPTVFAYDIINISNKSTFMKYYITADIHGFYTEFH
jgi:hypothetical protein